MKPLLVDALLSTDVPLPVAVSAVRSLRLTPICDADAEPIAMLKVTMSATLLDGSKLIVFACVNHVELPRAKPLGAVLVTTLDDAVIGAVTVAHNEPAAAESSNMPSMLSVKSSNPGTYALAVSARLVTSSISIVADGDTLRRYACNGSVP